MSATTRRRRLVRKPLGKPTNANTKTANLTVSDEGQNWLMRWEIPRKFYHSSIGFLVLSLYINSVPQSTAFTGVSVFLLFSILIESSRLLLSSRFNGLINKMLKPFMRPQERDGISGNTWYILGAFIVLYSLPLDLASLAIVYLSWCDPVASLVGQSLGRFTWKVGNKKSFAGLLGGVFMGMFVTWLFFTKLIHLRETSLDTLSGIEGKLPLNILVVVGGLVAGLSECTVIPGIDDNFTLPVASGFSLFAITKLLS